MLRSWAAIRLGSASYFGDQLPGVIAVGRLEWVLDNEARGLLLT